MIEVKFLTHKKLISGFEVSGHSGYADIGSDIVCASVSSAAYMTANTIHEILKVPTEAEVSDGDMRYILSSQEAEKAQDILKGFKLHMLELKEQYSKFIIIKNSEV